VFSRPCCKVKSDVNAKVSPVQILIQALSEPQHITLKAYNTGHAIVNQVRTFYLCLGRKQDHEDLLKGKRVWWIKP